MIPKLEIYLKTKHPPPCGRAAEDGDHTHNDEEGGEGEEEGRGVHVHDVFPLLRTRGGGRERFVH